jgi:hypothetical protein
LYHSRQVPRRVRTSLEGGVRAFSPKKGGTEKTEEEKENIEVAKQFFLLF